MDDNYLSSWRRAFGEILKRDPKIRRSLDKLIEKGCSSEGLEFLLADYTKPLDDHYKKTDPIEEREKKRKSQLKDHADLLARLAERLGQAAKTAANIRKDDENNGLAQTMNWPLRWHGVKKCSLDEFLSDAAQILSGRAADLRGMTDKRAKPAIRNRSGELLELVAYVKNRTKAKSYARVARLIDAAYKAHARANRTNHIYALAEHETVTEEKLKQRVINARAVSPNIQNQIRAEILKDHLLPPKRSVVKTPA